jgi:hydroxypyruvate reductase
MSQLKNGGLLAASGAARAITLLVSDVIDADPSVIASGPTLADDSTPSQAEAVIRHRLGVDPPRLGSRREPGRHHHRWQVIADGTIAAHAAAGVLEAEVWTTRLRGESSEQATAMVSARGEGAIVATGETTVTVRGPGVGGRNQEAALAAAIALDGGMGWFAAIGTDGIDGPTDAAGAIVDGGSVDRMRSSGVDPARALASNDSNPALQASGDLVITGPSGTNVGDLWVALP